MKDVELLLWHCTVIDFYALTNTRHETAVGINCLYALYKKLWLSSNQATGRKKLETQKILYIGAIKIRITSILAHLNSVPYLHSIQIFHPIKKCTHFFARNLCGINPTFLTSTLGFFFFLAFSLVPFLAA